MLLQQPAEEFYATLATFVRVANRKAEAIKKAKNGDEPD